MDLVRTLRTHPLMADIEVLDWRVPGKGSPGFIGVMNHHTVSRATSGRYPSKTVVTKGRPDVSGPLCNILGARDGGSIAVITDDEANHAGLGDPNVTAKAKANRPAGGKPGPDQSKADGRHHWLGIEWENDGTGEPWSPRMLETMHCTNAALCSVNGWDPMTRVVQHSEWSRRKIDCAFVTPPLSYDAFRRNIAALVAAPPEPKEWDQMATKEDLENVISARTAHLEAKLDALERQLDALAVGGYKGHQALLPAIDLVKAQLLPEHPQGSRSVRKLLELIYNVLYDSNGKPRDPIAKVLGL